LGWDFGGSSVGCGIAGYEVKVVLEVVLDVKLFEKPEDALGLGSLRSRRLVRELLGGRRA
jgi:hypothetical protein